MTGGIPCRTEERGVRGHGRWALLFRWTMPIWVAVGVLGAEVLLQRSAGPELPRKGQVARSTYRAQTDIVVDLHASYAQEARQARQSYLPIYIKDDKLLHRHKEPIVAAAMARGEKAWAWPDTPAAQEVPETGLVNDAGAPAQSASLPASGDQDVLSQPVDARSERHRADGASSPRAVSRPVIPDTSDLRVDAGAPLPLAWQVKAARRRDLQALLYGCFKFMEPYYEAGVIADNEFPNEKPLVRVLAYGAYRKQAVSKLRRFSELRPLLERAGAQFFYRVPAGVREQAIDFILQRLPSNLRYAAANKQHVSDISQVTGFKVVLVRRGEVVARRGQPVDTRADNALRLMSAHGGASINRRRLLGRFVLLCLMMALLAVAGWRLLGRAAPRLRILAAIGALVIIISAVGHWALARWGIHPLLVPGATVALTLAAVVGRGAAVVAALTVAGCLGISFYFDMETLLVGTLGGLAGAFVVRHRHRAAVLPAGVLVGIVQALTFEASRAAAGRAQTYGEMWAGSQAFFGGVLAGVFAFLIAPFVQRWFGMASRGHLRSLADFKHDLIRQLRERRPQVFIHTLRVTDLADAAAKAVGADRLLTRVAAQYHDIGKLDAEAEDPLQSVALRAEARRSHVEKGVAAARRLHFPEEVVALIEEHHGTSEMADLARAAAGDDEAVNRSTLSFAGPRPQTLESAILFIANHVAAVTTEISKHEDPTTAIEELVLDLIAQYQLADCQATHWQLRRIQDAMASFLKGVRPSE